MYFFLLFKVPPQHTEGHNIIIYKIKADYSWWTLSVEKYTKKPISRTNIKIIQEIEEYWYCQRKIALDGIKLAKHYFNLLQQRSKIKFISVETKGRFFKNTGVSWWKSSGRFYLFRGLFKISKVDPSFKN